MVQRHVEIRVRLRLHFVRIWQRYALADRQLVADGVLKPLDEGGAISLRRLVEGFAESGFAELFEEVESAKVYAALGGIGTDGFVVKLHQSGVEKKYTIWAKVSLRLALLVNGLPSRPINY